MFLHSILAGVLVLGRIGAQQAPNIVYVLFDDVGFSDLGRYVSDSPIPTPFIDNLTAQGVHLPNHYVHSVCSPTRAALLTGRYHVNTGMTNVLIPGTPAGLPHGIPTLPSLLNCLGGYSTAMAGKWHLGHAQHKMTPIGRGFDYFTGMYMWDLDSYTKQWYETPWEPPLLIDWVQEQRHYVDEPAAAVHDHSTCEDRPYTYTYKHYAEPRHATEAITSAAETYIQEHAGRNSQLAEEEQTPLFLYVAFTAAHSPLQPLPRHVAHCQHLKHGRRRDYCGMMVGLDEALRNLTSTMQQHLGENTILVVASDNGGSAYFGGMNTPLRGHKGTPFEGGVRVPAFIVDYTPGQKYLGAVPSAADVIAQLTTDKEVSEAEAEVQASTEGETAAHVEPVELLPRPVANVSFSRVFPGMIHVSDWLPTLLSYANVPAHKFPARLDGFDFGDALRTADYAEAKSMANICAGFNEADDALQHHTAASPRDGFLVEMYFANESVFNQTLVSYRQGDFKLIEGSVRDVNYYYESSTNRINSSHLSLGSHLIESVVELQDFLFGKGQSDTLNIMLVHVWMYDLIKMADWIYPLKSPVVHPSVENEGGLHATNLRLYNIIKDPCETKNLAEDPHYAPVIASIRAELAAIAARRPPMLPLDQQIDISRGSFFDRSHVPGDCSADPSIKPEHCRFTHSWVPDDADPMQQEGLMNATDYIRMRLWQQVSRAARVVLGVVAVVSVGRVFLFKK